MRQTHTRRKDMTKRKRVAAQNAARDGRKEVNILDAVPVCMTPEYLATVRKAFGIKAS